MSSELKIGFLGAGKMASALAKAFVQASLVTSKQILAADPIEAARAQFDQLTGAQTTSSNLDVVQAAPIVLLAVKPAQVEDVLREVRSACTPEHLIISIAAGVTLARLEGALGVPDAWFESCPTLRPWSALLPAHLPWASRAVPGWPTR